jgi:hypothetical protein
LKRVEKAYALLLREKYRGANQSQAIVEHVWRAVIMGTMKL